MSRLASRLGVGDQATGVPPGPRGHIILGSLRDLERDALRFLLSVRGRYGDVASLRILFSRAYLLSHPEHVKHVLQDRHTIYTKDTIDYRMLKPVLGNGLLTSDGAVWLRQRRLMQPAFQHARVAAFEGAITEQTLAMRDRWEDAARRETPINVAREMTRLALTIAAKVLFGHDIGDQAEVVSQAVTTLNEYLIGQFYSPWQLAALPTARNRRARRACRALDDVVCQIIQQRRAHGADTADVLSGLLLAQDQETGGGMTDAELRDEVVTLLVAGHETTASALAWTWYLLAIHPAAAARLRAEIDRLLAGRTPTVDDLPQLRFTRMVLEEAMRLYPPAWAFSRAPTEDDEIGGYRVPAKSLVLLSPYVTHRHPDFWERPERFDPERFTPERSRARPRFAYFPFGGGPRQCIGNEFATVEAQLVLAVVAQRYGLALVPGRRVEPEPAITLRPRSGLYMTLRRR
jgi:cytochrome P450